MILQVISGCDDAGYCNFLLSDDGTLTQSSTCSATYAAQCQYVWLEREGILQLDVNVFAGMTQLESM
jgi:hypothetical protein